CEVGASTFIGPFTEIQKNVVIGCRCRIQSHAFVCELVSIGDDCFIGHGVVFINDLFEDGGPACGDRAKWKPTRVGNRVSIGSNATILPVTIADGTGIGAGAVATKSSLLRRVGSQHPRQFPRPALRRSSWTWISIISSTSTNSRGRSPREPAR